MAINHGFVAKLYSLFNMAAAMEGKIIESFCCPNHWNCNRNHLEFHKCIWNNWNLQQSNIKVTEADVESWSHMKILHSCLQRFWQVITFVTFLLLFLWESRQIVANSESWQYKIQVINFCILRTSQNDDSYIAGFIVK